MRLRRLPPEQWQQQTWEGGQRDCGSRWPPDEDEGKSKGKRKGKRMGKGKGKGIQQGCGGSSSSGARGSWEDL